MPTPIPVDFTRGSTFSFSFGLPTSVEAGLFAGWALRAQIRKANNNMPSGLIADLSAFWQDKDLANKVVIFHSLTDKWPLGLAEVDVLLIDGGGQKIRTKKIVFNIVSGVTQ